MKKKSILTIVYIILSIILLILCSTYVFAKTNDIGVLADSAEKNGKLFWEAEVGDSFIYQTNVYHKKHWICLTEKKTSGVLGDKGIKIRALVDIDGGKYNSGIYGGTGKGGEINNYNTRMLAYLCYAATVKGDVGLVSSNTNGPRNALYNFFNTTNLESLIGAFSKKRTTDWNSESSRFGQKILEYAKKYANSETLDSNGDITDSLGTYAGVKSTNGYNYIGPFSVTSEGTVSSVTITDGTTKRTVAGFSNSLGGTVNSDIASIPLSKKNSEGKVVGRIFYIVTKDTLTSSNIKVKIETKGSAGGGKITNPNTGKTTKGYIKARIMFIGQDSSQGVALFRGDIQPTKETKDNVEFTVKNDLGKLLVQKVGVYAGKDNYENVKNLGFKLYRLDGSTKKYLRVNNVSEVKNQSSVSISSSVSYNETSGNATTFYTYNNGTIIIDNISVEHQYYIEETNVSSTNYQAKLAGATIQVGNGTVSNLTVNGNTAGPIKVELKGANNTAVKVKLSDYRKVGNVKIEKVDDKGKKLPNVKFTIKNTDTNTYVVGSKTSDGIYSVESSKSAYTSNSNGATKFTTGSNGTVTINGLAIGNYEITEVENLNYGYYVEGELPITIGKYKVNSGATTTVKATNKYRLGNIELLKVDSETNKPLKDVGFTIKMTSGVKKGQYLTGKNAESAYSNTPVTIKTDSNGKISIKDIWEGTYEVVEVSNPNHGYFVEGELPKTIGSYSVKARETTTVNSTNRYRLGSLEIYKEDETTKERLPNVGFTIKFTKGINNTQYEGKYLTGKDGKNAYSDTPVTVYTDKNGLIDIKDIWEGTYEVTEVVNPNYGYYVEGELPKKMGTFVISPYNTTKATYTNLRRWIKLTGLVWEDMLPNIKDPERNSLYSANDGDKLVANVTVKLKDKNGNDVSFKTKNGQTVKEILTDSIGQYEMWDIEIEKLAQYYIEFSYNGMSYTSVPIVDLSKTNKNSSKAKENEKERTTFNNNYSTITHNGTTTTTGEALNDRGNKTYDLKYDEISSGGDYGVSSKLVYGSNPLYGYDGQNYPVNRVDEQYIIKATTKDAYQDNGQSGYLTDFCTVGEIRQEGKEKIENINLGLLEREQPDLAIVEDVEDVKVKLNESEYTYKYSQRFNKNQESDGFDVGVKFQEKYNEESYTRTIYSSDIVYNMQPGNEESLQVYITYKIALRNESTSLYTKVNEIVNYYDSRYKVISVTNENGNSIKEVTEQGSVGNGYNKLTINTNQNIEAEKQSLIYITYKLNNEAVNSILNGNVTLKSITEISSYSSYSDSEFKIHYAGVDKDSRPGSSIPNNKTTYEDDTDSAPSFILEAENDGRKVTGVVWEDDAVEELLANTGYYKERKGDGIYNIGENTLGKVTVELFNCDNNGNLGDIASVYKKNGDVIEARTTTNNDGSYIIDGIVPGKYAIKYTYGKDSVIVKPDGSYEEIGILEKYKSTIYRKGDKQEAENMSDYWYREDIERMSDAVDENGIKEDGTKYDIIEERINEKNGESEKIYTYGSITNEENPEKLNKIEATTRGFDVELDYDENEIADNTSEFGAEFKYTFNNIDFGIIRRPIQNIEVRKEISYVQLKLSNGQIMVEGDPRKEEIKYLRFLPDGNVHVELDQEVIQGATLIVRYDIIVNNENVEIDYDDRDYYIYGTLADNNNWSIATISKLYDYVTNNMTFESQNVNNSNWEQVDVINRDLEEEGVLSKEAYEVAKGYNQVVQTSAFENMTPDTKEARVTLEISRILANNEEGYKLENDIEVNEVTGRRMEYEGNYTIPGDYIPSDTGRDTGYDDDYVYLTITGPTGENKNYIPYILLGIAGFIILEIGVIIIKKKVL